MSELRRGKAGFDTRFGNIDTEHPLYREELVDPRDYGLEGSIYYSRPNTLTGKALPGVPDAPLLRRTLVMRLLLANDFLRSNSFVRGALGAPAYLRIDDGLRPLAVQQYIFETAWPKLLRERNPTLTDEQLAVEVRKYCAEPKAATTATPHLTGGAADISLINADTGEPFDRGTFEGDTKGSIFPDFHEGHHLFEGCSDIANTPDQHPVAAKGSEVVMGRRILYYAVTNIARLLMNPHEIWHVGLGDPLSAYLSGTRAFYGIATPPVWYLAQMEGITLKK